MAFDNPVTGPRGIPNCVCREKLAETDLTTYHFDNRGYRNDLNLGPKPADSYRIVMVGTSVAAGFREPGEKIFATLLPKELSRRTGHKVELYNEGIPYRSPQLIARNFPDILSAKPDLILWVLTPYDIATTAWVMGPKKKVEPPQQDGHDNKSVGSWFKTLRRASTSFAHDSLYYLLDVFGHPRSVTLLRNIVFASPSQYMKSSLIADDYENGFLKEQLTPEWKKRLEEFDRNAANVIGLAKSAGVPLAAVLVPNRTQAAMTSMMGEWPTGLNPYKLDNALRSIIVGHGGAYIDILPGYRAVPNPQLGYFAVDGHLNSEGHALVTRLLANVLTDGSVPALRSTARPQAGLEKRG